MASHRKAQRAVDWSNPPPKFLSAITKRLVSGIDILRCRAVCKNWRAHINPNPRCLSPFLPCKISNSTLPFINRPNETLILVARTVFLVELLFCSNDSSNIWILTVEEAIPGASLNLSIGCLFNTSVEKLRSDYLRSTIAQALWPPPTSYRIHLLLAGMMRKVKD